MPFQGELKQATAYTINVDNTASGNKATAVTIIKINKRENVAAAEVHKVAAAQRVTIQDQFGARIDRVIIQVHPPRNVSVGIEVAQATASFPEVCAGDTDLVFDTIP